MDNYFSNFSNNSDLFEEISFSETQKLEIKVNDLSYPI